MEYEHEVLNSLVDESLNRLGIDIAHRSPILTKLTQEQGFVYPDAPFKKTAYISRIPYVNEQ